MADVTITLSGNITREPELKFTKTGQAQTRFAIAVNRRWQNKQTQNWEEQVSFFDVTSWGPLAENAAKSLKKGHRVLVTGRLEQRSWETPEGDKKSTVEVVAEDIAPSLRFSVAIPVTATKSTPTTTNPDDEPF